MLRTVEGRWGPCTYFEKDEYVGRSLRYYGEYGPDETEMILGLMGDGICLDIGANIGCISQAMLSAGADVVAFEPQPEVYALLAKNMGAVDNGRAGFKYAHYNYGLSNYNGKAKMPKVYYSAKGNFGGLGIGDLGLYGQIEVEIKRLDDLAEEASWGSEKISFIKIDVEGHELQVLEGGRSLIERDRPIMYIEDDRLAKSTDLRSYIRRLGYYIEEHKPCLFREQNFFGHKQNVWKQMYASHNIICRPC